MKVRRDFSKGMNSNQNQSLTGSVGNSISTDEIDLIQTFESLNRNKRLITLFTLSGLVLSGILAFTSKKIWQGEFQIVLESNNTPSQGISLNPKISAIARLSQQADQLKTEVGILKSPSVLINIFDFVKKEKSNKNNPSINKMRFKKWRESSLNIKLQNNTSILNLSYKDEDKDLILPVLNRISSTYQDYSGRKRIRNLQLGVDYFEEQVDLYREKSTESMRKVQEFAFEQDLSIPTSFGELESNDSKQTNSIHVEDMRIDASNNIRIIDQQLQKLEDLKDESEQLLYIVSTIASKRASLNSLSEELRGVDRQLAMLRVTYKEGDQSIKDALKERLYLIDLLKRKVKGSLIAEKDDYQALLKASRRPKGVLVNYRVLLNEAAKDKLTLDALEGQYISLLLENARNQDPWELITTPTLLPNPVAPKKASILSFGLIGGTFLGIAAALITERKKNLIFSIPELESLGRVPILCEISFKNKKSLEESLDLLINGPISNTEGSVALIAVGEIEDELISQLDKSINQFSTGRNFILTKDIREAMKFSNLIILTSLGVSSKKDYIETNNKISLLNKKPLGVLVIN